jgi:LacI family transcriptional regulator
MTARATLRDVAERVGCSVSAVSLVVNDRDGGRITPALRSRITRAIAELDYRPNGNARELATRRSTTVALVCPDVRNPFFADLFHGLTEVVGARFTVQLVLGGLGSDYDLDTVRAAQGGTIAGLVLANPAVDLLAGFSATCPTVLVDSPSGSDLFGSVSRVDLDLDGASAALASHLADLGHRRVAYLDLARAKDTFAIRRALLGSGLAAREGSLVSAATADEITVSAGRAAFLAAWPDWRDAGVTAIVCADDVLAYGVLLGARELGVAVPGTLSVAGFNDIPYSRLVEPSLTTVRFDAEGLGREAGVRLLAAIDGGLPESLVIPTTLEVRASTGPAVRAPIGPAAS